MQLFDNLIVPLHSIIVFCLRVVHIKYANVGTNSIKMIHFLGGTQNEMRDKYF